MTIFLQRGLHVISIAFVVILGVLFFPAANYLIELAHALTWQWVVVGLTLAVAHFFLRKWALGVALLALCLGHVYRITPYWPLKPNNPMFEQGLTVVQANVWHNNPLWHEAITNLSKLDVDFISIQELNSAWLPTANEKLGSYWPFSVTLPHDSCCYGIGLYSRHRLQFTEVFNWGNAPTIRAVAVTPLGKVVVYAVHSRPPVFPNETFFRDQTLDSLAHNIRNELYPVVVVGDLNIVPWDTKYQRLLQLAELTDARTGFQATYPMDFGFPLIPIDHIATTQLRSCGFETFVIPGSDHKGVIVRVGTL